MKPLSLKLRGFKGILAGMGVQEVGLDFALLPPGIVIFYAANGSGKTTIMNNMHPFRIMPDHVKSNYSPDAFSYYDHCYGPDACKDLIWGLDGTTYRSLISIDAIRRKQECYLLRQGESAWRPVNRDGKTESYDEAVEELLGSPELFFTSVFRGQEARSLSRYTKGTMKDLFVELLAIEGQKAVGAKAHEVRAALVGDLQVLARDRRAASDLAGQEEVQQENYRDIQNSLTQIQADMGVLEGEALKVQGNINVCLVSLAEYLKTAAERKRLEAELRGKKDRIAALERQSSAKETDYAGRIAMADARLQDARRLIEEAPLLEKKAEEKTVLESRLRDLKAEEKGITDVLDILVRKNEEFAKTVTALREKEKALQKVRMQRDFAIRETRKELDDAAAKEARLAGLPCSANEKLPADCPLASDAVAARKTIPGLKGKLRRLQEADCAETAIAGEVEKLNALLTGKEAHQDKIAEATRRRDGVKAEIGRIEAEVERLSPQLADIPRVKLAREMLPELEREAQKLPGEKTAALQEIKGQAKTLGKEIAVLDGKIKAAVIDEALPKKHEDLQGALATLQKDIAARRSEDGEKRKALGVVEEKLRNIETAKATIAGLEQQSEYLNNEISEWALLEKAFGADGIIPLVISDAGPSVATIANELLLTFGSRYSVRIDTQLMSADAKSLKEGFDIIVLDALTNEEKSLRRLSGGQKAWVEDAITRAICIFNSQKHGKTYNTLFTDEKDGALDALKKREYFDMKREVLRLGGYEHEYCITHTPELLARADAVIMIRNGRIEISTEPLDLEADLFGAA